LFKKSLTKVDAALLLDEGLQCGCRQSPPDMRYHEFFDELQTKFSAVRNNTTLH